MLTYYKDFACIFIGGLFLGISIGLLIPVDKKVECTEIKTQVLVPIAGNYVISCRVEK